MLLSRGTLGSSLRAPYSRSWDESCNTSLVELYYRIYMTMKLLWAAPAMMPRLLMDLPRDPPAAVKSPWLSSRQAPSHVVHRQFWSRKIVVVVHFGLVCLLSFL
jgi:hypothetical protein